MLRDPVAVREMLRALGVLDDFDAALPAFGRLRAAAGSVAKDDWAAHVKLGNALTALLLSATAAQ